MKFKVVVCVYGYQRWQVGVCVVLLAQAEGEGEAVSLVSLLSKELGPGALSQDPGIMT